MARNQEDSKRVNSTIAATKKTSKQAFADTVAAVNPTDEEVEFAKKLHVEIREGLQKFFRGAITTVFLNGSYKRRTANTKLHDVDVFVVFSDFPTQQQLEEALKNLHLSQKHTVEAQHHSFRLDITESKTTFDVVPARKSKESRGYEIKDWKRNKWVYTDPDAAKEECTAANKRADEKLVPLIKLLKYWNRLTGESYKKKKVFQSFHLEVMSYKADMAMAKTRSIEEAFWALLKIVSDQIDQAAMANHGITKAPGCNTVVDEYLFEQNKNSFTLPERQHLMKQAIRLCEDAIRSNAAPTAHEFWHQLLGEAYLEQL